MMCGVYQPTNVMSISYGWPESQNTAAYQERQCNEFMKLGLQGHTVLVASGDVGVAAEMGCDGPDKNLFAPDFPT